MEEYTISSLYKGFQFRELHSPVRSSSLLQTIKKIYKSEKYGMRVLCEHTTCGILEFSLPNLLKYLNNGIIIECNNEVYEIY